MVKVSISPSNFSNFFKSVLKKRVKRSLIRVDRVDWVVPDSTRDLPGAGWVGCFLTRDPSEPYPTHCQAYIQHLFELSYFFRSLFIWRSKEKFELAEQMDSRKILVFGGDEKKRGRKSKDGYDDDTTNFRGKNVKSLKKSEKKTIRSMCWAWPSYLVKGSLWDDDFC